MQLGETIATYDVALALRGESGKFEVTSPKGEIYHVTCKPNQSIASLEWSGDGTQPHPFLIRKVAEPVSLDQKESTAGKVEAGSPVRPTKTPFLIENQGIENKRDDLKPSSEAEAAAEVSQDDPLTSESAILDLIYWEKDPNTEQPSAYICLGAERLDQAGNRVRLTASSATFNELDVEIRRLQAQLDQIRSKARKQFYKSQGLAAGA